MQPSIQAALGALAAFVVYQVASVLLLWRRNAARAKELGCKRPPRLPSDPFGIMNVRDMLKADAAKRMPDWGLEKLDEMSAATGRVAHTMEVKMLPGKTWISTCEPKNVQAVLALQFKDFQLPQNRIGAFIPLLGNGIVCC